MSKKLSFEDLSRAFDRQSLQLQQTEQKLRLTTQRLSELESTLIAVRNLVGVRHDIRDEGPEEN